MKSKTTALIVTLIAVAGCSDINPYDRSKYEKAEKPIHKSTNYAVSEGMNSGQSEDQSGDWGSDTPSQEPAEFSGRR